MLRNILSLVVVAASFIFSAHQSGAGPLTAAEVTKIINQVSVVDPANGGHPAAIREVIKDDLGLQTGVQSRSELLFQDNTLTRIGAETFFSFKTGTRDMTLEKGSMLLQVPKGLGGAKIHTAAVTAAITGTTIMMEYVPDQYIKVLVLEGSLRLSRNGRFGDSLVLHPGKMVIMRPDAKKIPDPVDVDLAHLVRTSSLVNFPGAEPLPSIPLIQAAIDVQTKQLTKNNLVPTNLVMGHGTNVVVTPGNPLTATMGPNGILGAILTGGNSKNGAVSLPLVGNVASTLSTTTTATTTTLNNVINSATGTVGGIANNLLGTSSTLPSIPISSSTQVLSLLDNAVANATGTLTVAPTIANVGTTVAAAPTLVVNSSPVLSNVVTTLADPVGNVTGTVSATGNTSTTPIGSVLSAPTLISTTPTSVASTVASVPTTLSAVTLASPNSRPSALPIGLGH